MHIAILKKVIRKLNGFCIVLLLLLLLMQGIGLIHFVYEGFAIDRFEHIYIGKDKNIVVYNTNGKVLRSIYPHTNRGYGFEILNGEILLVETGTEIIEMSLDGDILSTRPRSDEYSEISREWIVSLPSGQTYEMKRPLGYWLLCRVDVTPPIVVFRMPLQDYAVRILLVLCSISIVLNVVFTTIKKMKGRMN